MEHKENSTNAFELVTTSPIELVRSASGEAFQGYAALYYDPANPGTEYRPTEHIRERLMPGAFSDVVKQNKTELWYEHDKAHVLASTETGTLFLSEDTRGVKYYAPFDATDPDHQKVAAKIRKGIAKGSSFRFTGSYTTKRDKGEFIRCIDRIDSMREISVVNKPAYSAAYVQLRSADAALMNETELRRQAFAKKFGS